MERNSLPRFGVDWVEQLLDRLLVAVTRDGFDRAQFSMEQIGYRVLFNEVVPTQVSETACQGPLNSLQNTALTRTIGPKQEG